MNINRHNYEAFFLLYVDNELSATERKAVDVFVQENPDLQIELGLLQETVVKADDIVLDKKDWLYMEEDITALQEDLLLYADGELNDAGKRNVEALIATDKRAIAEWNILQQVKLEPDMAIVFDDKQLLYRKEPVRVVPFKWWRVAAAAALVGFGLWTGVSVYKNAVATKTDTELVNNKEKGKTDLLQIQAETGPGNNLATRQPGQTTAEDITSTPIQKNNVSQPANDNKTVAYNTIDQNLVSSKENITVQNNNNKKQNTNLPKPSSQNNNSINSNEIAVQSVSPSNNSSRVSGNNESVVKLTPNKAIVETVNSNKADPNITAIAVVNTNKAADAENNNRYLDVDDDKQKRSGLGGFLRKAKRVLERTTNVKTGEGVKIAGFEIALK